MSAPTKTCRHCVHAVWVMSPSGKTISRVLPGRCEKWMSLAAAVDRRPYPCVAVSARDSWIWPNSDATNCPRYKHKDGAA